MVFGSSGFGQSDFGHSDPCFGQSLFGSHCANGVTGLPADTPPSGRGRPGHHSTGEVGRLAHGRARLCRRRGSRRPSLRCRGDLAALAGESQLAHQRDGHAQLAPILEFQLVDGAVLRDILAGQDLSVAQDDLGAGARRADGREQQRPEQGRREQRRREPPGSLPVSSPWIPINAASRRPDCRSKRPRHQIRRR